MEASVKQENSDIVLRLRTADSKVWSSTKLLDRIGEKAGKSVARELRRMACEQLGHEWTDIPQHVRDSGVDWTRLCERCQFVEVDAP